MSKLVSIIIPTYNGEKWIAEALESAINQTYKEIEIIVIDSFSEDRTVEIVENFRKKDSRIRLIMNERKKGVQISRNIGIKNSHGEYISFLDQDDIYLPFKTELQLKYMEQNPFYGMVYGGVIVYGFKFNFLEKTFIEKSPELLYFPQKIYTFSSSQKQLLFDTICSACSVLIRREVFDVVGLLDEDIEKADDYDLWCRIVKFFPIQTFPISPVYIYREHPNMSSIKNIGDYRFYCDYAALKHFWSMDMEIFNEKGNLSEEIWNLAKYFLSTAITYIKNNGFHLLRVDTILEMMKKSHEISPTKEKEKKIEEFENGIEKILKEYYNSTKRITEEDKKVIRRKAEEIKMKLKNFKERKIEIQEYFLKKEIKRVEIKVNPKFTIFLIGEENEDTYKSIKNQKGNIEIRRCETIEREKIEGEYVSFIFGGDKLIDGAIEHFIKEINLGGEIIYSDEGYEEGKTKKPLILKPDFSPHTLEFFNYISEFTIIKKDLLPDKIKLQDFFLWDVIRYATKKVNIKNIKHIRKVLYINKNMGRWEIERKLDKFTPEIQNKLISIIIPNKDNLPFLKRCIKSIEEKSTYKNYEIIIVENNSEREETFKYYKEIENKESIRILNLGKLKNFNFSKLINFGVEKTRGDVLLFLNNDVEVITPDWLEQMLHFALKEEVGVVGAYLYFIDKKIQHAGVHITCPYGTIYTPEHIFYRESEQDYFFMSLYPRNVSAVTGAAIMIRKDVFYELGGFDENIEVCFGDIDLCLMAIKKGFFNVITPYAKLIHYEKVSREKDLNASEIEDIRNFVEKHKDFIERDPFSSDFLYIKNKINMLRNWLR